MYYYFSDQIGTAQLIFNATSGAVCYDSDSTPFGYQMVYTSGCAQEYEFAGMELDSETASYATWFRNYEPNLGRWMSPDPLGGDITNPQTLNRYPYALNGPTTLTDPMGLDAAACGDPFYAEGNADCGSPGNGGWGWGGGGGGWGGGWGDAFGPYGLLCDDPEDPDNFCFTIYLPMPGAGIGGGGGGGGTAGGNSSGASAMGNGFSGPPWECSSNAIFLNSFDWTWKLGFELKTPLLQATATLNKNATTGETGSEVSVGVAGLGVGATVTQPPGVPINSDAGTAVATANAGPVSVNLNTWQVTTSWGGLVAKYARLGAALGVGGEISFNLARFRQLNAQCGVAP